MISYLSPMKVGKKSLIVMLLAMIAILVLRLLIADSDKTLTWDVFGYYLYLPAYFIYGDLSLQNMDWVNQIMETYHVSGTLYQAIQIDSGNWVMRYPGGLALLNAPFFFIADALASPMGFARDGFSVPYQMAWIIGGIFYAFVGLIYARKLLLQFFSDEWTALLLLLIVFATNYLEQATFSNPLAHNYLFALYALVLYLVSKWKDIIHWKSALAVGLLGGLIAMCRPNEILIILIPVLWKCSPWSNSLAYGDFLKKNAVAIGAAGLGLFVGGFPQMLYWHSVSGEWFFYSYQDNGVGFDFDRPHLLNFLFSFRKGWYIYTPIMLLATLGFIQLYKSNRKLFIPLFSFFLLNLYIVASWSVWWYGGGSYSSRSMVPAYLIMAFPLGYLLIWLKQKGKGVWTGTVFLISAMMLLNLFQFWQFNAKIIDPERMTADYYWSVFGKTSVPEGAEQLLLVERQTTAIEKMPEDTSHLSRSVLHEVWLGTTADQDNRVQLEWPDESLEAVAFMDESHPFTNAFELGYTEITDKEYAWLKINTTIYIPDSVEAEAPMLVTQFNYKDKPYKYTTTEYLGPQIKKGEWQTISMDYMTPEVRTKKDRLKVYLWYRGKDPVYARSLEIIKYEPKRP